MQASSLFYREGRMGCFQGIKEGEHGAVQSDAASVTVTREGHTREMGQH